MSKDQNPSDKACDAYFDNPYAATSGSYYSDRVTFYAGFAAGAASRDAEIAELAAAIEQMQSQLLFCAEYLEDCANSPYNAAQCRRVAQLQPSPDLLAKRDQRRDAEVAKLKTVPMRYRRMAFNAQLQDEVARLEQENDQLRAQIAELVEALEWVRKVTLDFEMHDAIDFALDKVRKP